MAVVHDALSEQLISQLLQEDVQLLDAYRQAEKLQLDHVIALSSQTQGRIPKYSKNDAQENPDNDADLAFKLYVSEAGISRDASYAQEMQNDIFAANTADVQLAQSLAANERKIDFDAQFARKLQEIDDEGNVDIDSIVDAESVLGDWKGSKELNAPANDAANLKHEPTVKTEAEFDTFTTSSKGKGKGRLFSPPTSPDNKKRLRYDTEFSVKMEEDEDMLSFSHSPYPVCNICMEPFNVTHSPFTAALSANSSSKLPFGLRLPCPKEHAYCISCLTTYIQTKLDPDGRGVGKSSAPVFPIRCPECPLVAWPEGIDDDVAQRVLGERGMDEWALPADERSPEDRAVLDLAKVGLSAHLYQILIRVPGRTMETVSQLFGTVTFQCKSNPPCELWDEDRLLEARERQRHQQAQAAAQRVAQQPAVNAFQPPAHPVHVFQVPPLPAGAFLGHAQHVDAFRAPVYQARAYENYGGDEDEYEYDDLRWISDPGLPSPLALIKFSL
ncbi:hypothetical protein H0H92_003939 [Tricholoma furcatifolium]|nr:hypothetical protein H0H92_003939 [Tricholoma furcatifolium]